MRKTTPEAATGYDDTHVSALLLHHHPEKIINMELKSLLKVEVFVDFFNTFLSLPVFGQTPLYMLEENKWLMWPNVSFAQVNAGAFLKGLETHRMVFFKQTELHHNFILCTEILDFTSSKSTEDLKWTPELVLFCVRVSLLLSMKEEENEDEFQTLNQQALQTVIRPERRLCHPVYITLLFKSFESLMLTKNTVILFKFKTTYILFAYIEKCDLFLWSKLNFKHHYSSLQCHVQANVPVSKAMSLQIKTLKKNSIFERPSTKPRQFLQELSADGALLFIQEAVQPKRQKAKVRTIADKFFRREDPTCFGVCLPLQCSADIITSVTQMDSVPPDIYTIQHLVAKSLEAETCFQPPSRSVRSRAEFEEYLTQDYKRFSEDTHCSVEADVLTSHTHTTVEADVLTSHTHTTVEADVLTSHTHCTVEADVLTSHTHTKQTFSHHTHTHTVEADVLTSHTHCSVEADVLTSHTHCRVEADVLISHTHTSVEADVLTSHTHTVV
ncbi:unnamed protein product [Leuciscus chuanchicus]